jgi:hypothetical protein
MITRGVAERRREQDGRSRSVQELAPTKITSTETDRDIYKRIQIIYSVTNKKNAFVSSAEAPAAFFVAWQKGRCHRCSGFYRRSEL